MKFLKSIYSFLSKPIFSYLIFWGWNFIFLILLLSSAGILTETVKNVITGFTPLSYSICVLFFLLIPVMSTIIGAKYLRKKPKRLMQFFYGIELPLWVLFLLKFVLFRELTTASSHIFLIFFLGLIGYVVEVFSLKNKLPDWYKYTHKLLLSFLFFIGVFIFFVGIIYSLPLIWMFLVEFFSFDWISSFELSDLKFMSFFLFVFIIFAIITFPIIVLLPILMVYLYSKSFIEEYKLHKLGSLKYFGLLVFVGNILVFVFLNSTQSQQNAFEIAEKNMTIVSNRKHLYDNESGVKEGLLNAYLNEYRYISSIKNNHIKELYKDFLNNDYLAEGVQSSYNYLMSPFLYKGDRDNDTKKAAKLYESLFDIGIQKDNKKAIVASLSSTWDRDGVEAGVLNVNEEKVLLLKQEINIKENKGTASIDIHEVYKNMTFNRQEIFYYFKIPPNTVVNGLWLSDNDSIAKKYPFKVSPRGAAQQVYKEQVRRNVDPSLLEQVGPYQYRLRAFPILPKIRVYRNKKYVVTEGDNFHLWISLKTIISSENDWKLPQLIEKRNVYWDDNSERYLNGEKLAINDWLPMSIKPKGSFVRNEFVESLNDTLSVLVKEKDIIKNNYLKDKRVSFIVDGSFSMHDHLSSLSETLNYFSKNNISNQSKLYLFNREHNKDFVDLSNRFNINEDDFYGTISNIEVLHKFKAKNTDQDYIVYLTDDGGYDETIDSLTSVSFNVPLIVFHLNNSTAPIYADSFLESIQNSKGFICEDVKEINNQLYTKVDERILSYQDGLVYEKVNSKEENSSLIKDLVAYQYINNTKINETNKINWLDEIHRIAVQNKIVTKFSSMIVLVNDAQKKRLEELEKEKDRFDREKEDGKETISSPNDIFSVNAAPEPEEWILIILISIYVFYHYYKKRVSYKS